ncbi:hypothetical protein M432DRAFT_127692 [Thermoascus aurantiacus ATCC 26904]
MVRLTSSGDERILSSNDTREELPPHDDFRNQSKSSNSSRREPILVLFPRQFFSRASIVEEILLPLSLELLFEIEINTPLITSSLATLYLPGVNRDPPLAHFAVTGGLSVDLFRRPIDRDRELGNRKRYASQTSQTDAIHSAALFFALLSIRFTDVCRHTPECYAFNTICCSALIPSSSCLTRYPVSGGYGCTISIPAD